MPEEDRAKVKGVIGGRQWERQEAYWYPPDQEVIKINVDGAFNPVTGDAAVGVITRDSDGQPHIMAWRVVCRCRNAEEAEALALPEGAKLAEHWSANSHVEFK
jgi:ribonuclease HI